MTIPSPASHVSRFALLLIALLGSACGNKPQREVAPSTVKLEDVPPVLRGTIGAEAAIRGTEPSLVSGFGIVVGLNGTGGGEYPLANWSDPFVRAYARAAWHNNKFFSIEAQLGIEENFRNEDSPNFFRAKDARSTVISGEVMMRLKLGNILPDDIFRTRKNTKDSRVNDTNKTVDFINKKSGNPILILE